MELLVIIPMIVFIIGGYVFWIVFFVNMINEDSQYKKRQAEYERLRREDQQKAYEENKRLMNLIDQGPPFVCKDIDCTWPYCEYYCCYIGPHEKDELPPKIGEARGQTRLRY